MCSSMKYVFKVNFRIAIIKLSVNIIMCSQLQTLSVKYNYLCIFCQNLTLKLYQDIHYNIKSIIQLKSTLFP